MSEEQELANQALEAGDADKLRRVLEGNPSLVSWLLEDCAPALHSAAEANHAGMVQLLLDLGADVNARGFNSWTPLHAAAWNGAPEAAEVLIDRGADLEAREFYNYPPLFFATRYNGLPGYAVLGLLLKRGAKLDILSAIELSQNHVVHALLKQRPDILQTDPNADDFLSVAVSRNNLELVRMLIESGAKVNTSRHFDLPLTIALSLPREQAIPTIKYLLAAGADPNRKGDSEKPSPLEWAKRHSPELLRLFSPQP